MQIIKLNNRTVVLVENGEVRLAQLPTGVFYSPAWKAWAVLIPKKGGGWEKVAISVKRGIITAFDEAVMLREKHVGVLVKKRLIKRYLKGYTGSLNKDGYYHVTDPVTGSRRRFETFDAAQRHNRTTLDKWLDVYQIPYSEIYEDIRHVGNEHSSSERKTTARLVASTGAEASAHHYL